VAQQVDTDAWVIRHLERLPLGTAYPQVATHLALIVTRAWHQGRREVPATPLPTVRVDATGVGAPVCDLLRDELGPEVPLVAVTFTHGDQYTEDASGRTARLGKAYLVSRLQALLQTQRLRFPRTLAEAPALTQELLDYEIKVDQDANDRYGAFKVGTHDDLVTAVGLAVLAAPQYAGVWFI
jgi:hypothetical protein